MSFQQMHKCYFIQSCINIFFFCIMHFIIHFFFRTGQDSVLSKVPIVKFICDVVSWVFLSKFHNVKMQLYPSVYV